VLHLGADVGDPLPPVAVGQQVTLQPLPLVGCLRLHRPTGAVMTSSGELGSRDTGSAAEYQTFRKRVGAQPIGAVDAHAGHLARRVEAREPGRAVDVGVHAAHHVVLDRPDRDQLVHRVEALVQPAQLAHLRQPGLDQLLPEVAQVEIHDRAVRGVHRAALLLLMDERLGQPVPRTELHAAQHRGGRGRAQVVILQVAVAVLIQQPAALGAGRLGDQDAGEGQAGRVVLDELPVLQGGARPVGQRHPVPGLDVAIGGEREHPPAAARAQDDGLAGDGLDPAGLRVGVAWQQPGPGRLSAPDTP
jgi:hypothetical protein